jgi:hypothetical protein
MNILKKLNQLKFKISNTIYQLLLELWTDFATHLLQFLNANYILTSVMIASVLKFMCCVRQQRGGLRVIILHTRRILRFLRAQILYPNQFLFVSEGFVWGATAVHSYLFIYLRIYAYTSVPDVLWSTIAGTSYSSSYELVCGVIDLLVVIVVSRQPWSSKIVGRIHVHD